MLKLLVCNLVRQLNKAFMFQIYGWLHFFFMRIRFFSIFSDGTMADSAKYSVFYSHVSQAKNAVQVLFYLDWQFNANHVLLWPKTKSGINHIKNWCFHLASHASFYVPKYDWHSFHHLWKWKYFLYNLVRQLNSGLVPNGILIRSTLQEDI